MKIDITFAGAVKVDDRVVGMVTRTGRGIIYQHYKFGMRATDPMLDYDEFMSKLTGFLQKSFA
jgi:hypothetical protein